MLDVFVKLNKTIIEVLALLWSLLSKWKHLGIFKCLIWKTWSWQAWSLVQGSTQCFVQGYGCGTSLAIIQWLKKEDQEKTKKFSIH